MKNFKFYTGLSVLSLALLLSVSSPVVASCVTPEDITCQCCDLCGDWCGTRANPEYIYSLDNNFRVSRSKSDYDSIIVESIAWGEVLVKCENCICGYDCTGQYEEVAYPEETVFKFKNLVSFSFSKDSKYLLVERSEYNTKINAQNDFIEIFDLVNKKRIFFMPFIQKCYPSKYYFASKGYNVGNLFLNFYEDTLESVGLDCVSVPVNLYDVQSVYMSPVAIALSVKFNDGSIKVYLPKKDFSGLNILATFENNFSVDKVFHIPHYCC